jgi:Zn-dependent protease with chaperone function
MKTAKTLTALLSFILIIFSGILVIINPPVSNSPLSLEPLLNSLAKIIQRGDYTFQRITLLSEVDEKNLGIKLKEAIPGSYRANSLDRDYAESVLANIEPSLKKDFVYEIYISNTLAPYAHALPGGTVLLSRGLLDFLETEAQLAALIAHQLAHIELGHCRTSVELHRTGDKSQFRTEERMYDYLFDLLGDSYFSLSEENEADEYAYRLLEQSPYDLNSLGEIFSLFDQNSIRLDQLGEIFQSNPDLQFRAAKFLQRSAGNLERRYRGMQNLLLRQAFPELELSQEWSN